MLHQFSFAIIVGLAMMSFGNAFVFTSTRLISHSLTTKSSSLRMAVEEVNSVEEFDEIVKGAGSKLVVIDYSTTWCGPCKMVLPKYMELSDKIGDVIFLKCIGDSTPEASKLLKREGVRSVPAFHLWKDGSRLDTIMGAKIDEVEAAVKSNK